MKDKQFRNLIEHAYPVQKQAMYEALKRELNLPDDAAVLAPAEDISVALAESTSAGTVVHKPASKWRNFFKKPARLATCVSMAVAVACLAIILPFTLNQGGVQTTPTISEERFVEATACREIKLDYSLKEYSERNDLPLLYVNWYDVADAVTSLNVDKEDQTDIVFYHEIMMHKYTGSIVELYITDLRTRVDKLETYKKSCKNIYNVYTEKYSKVQVYWGVGLINKYEPYTYEAWFKYGDYIYVIVLRYPLDDNEIFELIDSLMPAVYRINKWL